MVTQDISSGLPASEPGHSSREPSPPEPDSGDEHQSTIGSLPPARPQLDIQLARRLARSGSLGPGSAGSAAFTNSFGDVVRCAGPRSPSLVEPAELAEPDGDGDDVVVDGGYGWFVAFGAFLANICTSGTIKSFGLISLQLQELFNVSAAEISVVTAILLTTGLLLSPLVGALSQKYSCRRVATFGGLLCFLGFSLSSLATSITHLCLTIGVLVGFGSGCVSTSGILIATRYFPTRRSLVNGLVLAGNAAGGFIMPPLFQFFLAAYGVRSSLLLIGAVCLHVIVGAAFFRPVTLHEKFLRQRRRRQPQQPQQTPQGADLRPLTSAGAPDSTSAEKASLTEGGSLANKTSLSEKSPSAASESVTSEFRFPVRPAAGGRTRTVSESLWRERRSSSLRPPPAGGLLRRDTVAGSRPRIVEVKRRDSHGQEVRLLVEVPQRLRTSSLMLSTADITTDVTTQLDDDLRKLRDGGGGGCAPGVLRSLRQLLNLQLLANPLFLVEVASVFLMASGTPYVMLQLPAFGVSRGLTPTETAEMLSIASALDLVSRLSFGWLLDQGLFRRQYALAFSQLLGGGIVLVMPFCYSYGSILALSLVFSVGMGTWFINLAPVLADNHGIENIAASYGLARMFHGLASLVTPPIFGAIVDSTGDYGTQFFAMGALMSLGGLLILLAMLTGMDKKYGECETPVEEPTQTKVEKSANKV